MDFEISTHVYTTVIIVFLVWYAFGARNEGPYSNLRMRIGFEVAGEAAYCACAKNTALISVGT